MVRAFVLYEGDVDPERYQQHVDEFVSQIPATFRQGKSSRTPLGEARFHHYAEFEFPDMESFQAGRGLARVRRHRRGRRRRWAIPFSAQVVLVEV